MGDAYWAVMHLTLLDNSATTAGDNGAESADDDDTDESGDEGWTRAQQMVIYPLMGLCLWNLVGGSIGGCHHCQFQPSLVLLQIPATDPHY